jgi:hypothetical protein
LIRDKGLDFKIGKSSHSKTEVAFEWIRGRISWSSSRQNQAKTNPGGKLACHIELTLNFIEVKENIDWFDVKALIIGLAVPL